MLRIGIDVGGTHTDAVLLDGDAVIASTKALTSADVTTGILEALETILSQHPGMEKSVAAVMLGTTQFTNAVVQRRELAEVAAVRIGMPSGMGLPPKIGWPDDIAGCLGDNVYMIRGGYLYDGWPLADLCDKEMKSVVDDLKAKKVEAVAISSAFSPMNAEPEQILAKRIRAAMPNIRITRVAQYWPARNPGAGKCSLAECEPAQFRRSRRHLVRRGNSQTWPDVSILCQSK